VIVFTKGELRLERLRIVGRGKSLFCFPPPGAALFFRLISDRYGRASTAITTNKSVKEWPGVFAGDQAMTAAILDRLLHRCVVFNIRGRSYRLQDLEKLLQSTHPFDSPERPWPPWGINSPTHQPSPSLLLRCVNLPVR